MLSIVFSLSLGIRNYHPSAIAIKSVHIILATGILSESLNSKIWG